MTFSSAIFLFFFFPLAFLLYTCWPGIRGKNILLLLMNLVFYTFGQWQGLPLLLLCALINYGAGRLLSRETGGKAALIAAVGVNLLLLGSLKYLDFLIETVNAALSLQIPPAGLLQPLGISFFTFKGISYLADVYRKKHPTERNFLHMLTYLSFFPQVTAGPIARFSPFAAQLSQRTAGPEQIALGLRRFVVGFAKKVLISGQVAAIADAAFGLGGSLDIRMAWLGAVAYTVQIYFDFSGYSDMAIGLGMAFGFVTGENFLYPYAAVSLTDFWRRWHISLSSWFRDYVYIPLGGNRKGKPRQMINKGVVFLLCGLWHGASWTFILWGGWHAVFSALESAAAAPVKRLEGSRAGRLLLRSCTLLVVCLGFVIFRADSLTQAAQVLGAMFTGFDLTPAARLAVERITPAAWCALVGGLAACTPVLPALRQRLGSRTEHTGLRAASFVGAAVMLALCVMAASASGFQPFIYAWF